MMKNNLWVVVAILCCTSVLAYQTNHTLFFQVSNNTITSGGAQIICGGYIYNLQINTPNFTNSLNWTLDVPDCNNATTCDYLRGPINNLTNTCQDTINNITKTCDNMVNLMNTSFKYYPLYADCYANLTLALKEARDKDYYENKSNICETEKNTYQSSYQSCTNQLNVCNAEKADADTKLKNKSNQVIFAAILGAVAGAGGLWYLKIKPKTAKSPADITGRAP